MNTVNLLIYTLLSLIILILHSYFTKGFRLTLNFFLFAIIAGIEKEFNTFLASDFAVPQRPSPFFFPSEHIPFFAHLAMVITGWAIVFYISWVIAEKIINTRIGPFKNRLFPVVLMAGLITASMSYAIETTGVSAGWWRWVFKDMRFSRFLVGETHLFAIEAWFYFAIHFLGAYLLIECSKYKRKPWKAVFFLIYLVRICTIIFSSVDLPRVIEEYLALFLLICMVLFNPLRLDYSNISIPAIKPKTRKILNAVPYAIIISMVLILLALNAFKAKEPELLFSLVPICFCILLAFGKIPLSTLVFLGISLLIAGRDKTIAGLLPLLIVITLNLLGTGTLYLYGKNRDDKTPQFKTL